MSMKTISEIKLYLGSDIYVREYEWKDKMFIDLY